MAPALKRRGDFLEPLFQTLQRLRFDHGAHLREHPHEASRFAMVELLVTSLAVDPRCFSDQAA
jgi:hypothetical protein